MDVGLRAVSEPLGLGGDDVVLMFSPLGHQTGYLYGMCMPLKYGMKLVLQDAWDPATMLRLVGDERVTWTMGTTTFVLDACAAAAQLPDTDLSSLRYFTCGGAPIPPKAVTEARARLGTQLVAVWGMTEIGVCTITAPSDSDETVCSSDGRPVEWAELRIVDGDGHDVAPGEAGRLLARTPSQHLTYLGRPDLFAAAFPDGIEAGWFDTGDLARQAPDGSIRITGRSKDLIIRGGENIPVAEVEAGVISHPLVHEVAVVGYPDDRLGEKVCAVVVPVGDEAQTLEDLRSHLDALGMAKPFWPERLVVRDALPKTASGKTQKFALREELATE
jgi:cyclohexanecarboxylate-CoA ligase